MGHFYNWMVVLLVGTPAVFGRSARLIFQDDDNSLRTAREYGYNPQQSFQPSQGFSVGGPSNVGYFPGGIAIPAPLQSSVVYTKPFTTLQQPSLAASSFESGSGSAGVGILDSGIFGGSVQGQLYPVSDVNILNRPRPRKRYKIVFVKAPTRPLPQIIVPAAPQVQRKTIVYVLSEKQKPPKVTSVGGPAGAPSIPSKPEVFFIRYDANDGLNGGPSGIPTSFTSPSYGKNIDGQTYKSSSY